MAAKRTLHNTVVPAQWVGQPLRDFLTGHLQLSSRQIQRVVRTKGLFVNGRPGHTNMVLAAGQRVKVLLPRHEQLRLEPKPMELVVLYNDTQILAVDKPTGLAVHPTKSGESPTLVAGVAHYLKTTYGRAIVPHPVHRLDKEASGVVVFALSGLIQTELTQLWNTDCVYKRYWVLVHGRLENRLILDHAIGGKQALTKIIPHSIHGGFSVVNAELFSGRTHQIRRHLADAGYPIVGDRRYGGSGQSKAAARLGLHAQEIRLECPSLHKPILLVSPPPTPHDVIGEEV